MKKRVTAIGGIFFKVKDPTKTKDWYKKHLGLQTDDYGTTFEWRSSENPNQKGFTQWSPMKDDTTYFKPSDKDFMVNYCVENLVELVEELKKEGVTILDEIESYDYGKFVHILDPDGHSIELWEPVNEVYDEMVEKKTES
ncbi:VOC family protein [Algoriphagus sp. SE2]|uniref:VOC family protein n=1 Tax=Algoriphagus sp. SE2 TaxID=3141536 RepID=UPI0031CD9AD6